MQRELEKERAHVARLLEAHQREHDARAKAAAEAAAAAARKQCEDAVAAERERVRRAQAQQQEQDNAVQAAVNTAVLALQASEARSSLTVRPVSSERTPAMLQLKISSFKHYQ
jgi:seryl-tRNA synthetase